VYVHQQALDRGELGIFLLNGSAYCKRLAGGEKPVLESLNTRYPPLRVGPYDEFRVMGKIVE
jgi:SOS-response transcriptional repressor LexA